jgi:hypothetical protein
LSSQDIRSHWEAYWQNRNLHTKDKKRLPEGNRFVRLA